MAPLTGTSITFTIQYAFQINKPTRKKKPGKPKTCRAKSEFTFLLSNQGISAIFVYHRHRDLISYRSLLTQKIQEGLDASAKFLYLFGSYALQVGDIVEIAVLGCLGQHTGITAEDGIRDADKLIAPEAAILGSKAETRKQRIDIVIL